MYTEIIIDQILILTILVLIGAGAIKLKILSENLEEGIARLVFNITLPLMILTNLSRLDLTPEIIRNGSLVILVSFISLFLMFGIGNAASRLQRLDSRKHTIYVLHSMFGNIVFLGYPLIDTLFPGGEGLLYATLFYLSSNTLQWTLGIAILSRGKKIVWYKHLRNLLNPNTIALVLGLLMMGFSIRLPEILHIPLEGLGDTTLYLSMIYIGAIIIRTSMKGILRRYYIFILSFHKLIVSPFLMILILAGLEQLLGLGLNTVAGSVVILQTAMPCMAIVVVLAKTYGADENLAAENVVLSTILSLFSLPLVYFLLLSF